MSAQTLTLTLPPRLAAAVRFDAMARGKDPESWALHYLSDTFHHEVGAGHFPGKSSEEVAAWLLLETPAERRLREAEAMLLRRARELAASFLDEDADSDAATDAWSEAMNRLSDAFKRAHSQRP